VGGTEILDPFCNVNYLTVSRLYYERRRIHWMVTLLSSRSRDEDATDAEPFDSSRRAAAVHGTLEVRQVMQEDPCR
jgi:hypothetical protein